MLVIDKAEKSDVIMDPFPHIVIRDAVDQNLCARLVEEFPPLDFVAKRDQWKNNHRFSVPALDVLESTFSPTWKEFVAANASQEFWQKWVTIFGDATRRLYPRFESRHGKLEELSVAFRGTNNPAAEIFCDAQIAINTPVTVPSRVRGAHVDLPNKLYAGLFYLRHPDDDSHGGELEIIRSKPGRTVKFVKQFASYDDVEIVNTVPYERNVLVLLVNCPHAIHGVTERSVTRFPRMFMNLVGEVADRLFSLPQKSVSEKMLGGYVQQT